MKKKVEKTEDVFSAFQKRVGLKDIMGKAERYPTQKRKN